MQVPRFPFGADPGTVRTGIDRLGIEFPVVIDDRQELATDGCEGWPSLFLWGRGGILQVPLRRGRLPFDRRGHPGESRQGGCRRGASGTDGSDPRDRRPGHRSDRARGRTDPAEGRAWTIEEDGDGFDIEYEGGGIHVTAGASGSLLTVIDGVPSEAIEIDGPGLYTVAEHDRHGTHSVVSRSSWSVYPEIWSVSFSPAPA